MLFPRKELEKVLVSIRARGHSPKKMEFFLENKWYKIQKVKTTKISMRVVTSILKLLLRILIKIKQICRAMRIRVKRECKNLNRKWQNSNIFLQSKPLLTWKNLTKATKRRTKVKVQKESLENKNSQNRIKHQYRLSTRYQKPRFKKTSLWTKTVLQLNLKIYSQVAWTSRISKCWERSNIMTKGNNLSWTIRQPHQNPTICKKIQMWSSTLIYNNHLISTWWLTKK